MNQVEQNETISYPKISTKKSESITELAKALCNAQATMTTAKKDSLNPHFKSKYADLASVWDACREALTKNGLSIVQIPQADGNRITVSTILLHTSGEFIEGDLTMISGANTPQAFGSCITYARRYALSAFVGIAPDDDDGEEATKAFRGKQNKNPTHTKPNEEDIKKLVGAFDKFGINRYMLEDYCGQKNVDEFDVSDFNRCRVLYKEFESGSMTIEKLNESLYGFKAKDNRQESETLGALESAFNTEK